MKLLVKIVLDVIPIPYTFFQNFNVFKHGFMKDPEYCLKAFETFIGTKSNLKEKQIVEIGPGDSINTAIIASALGAKRTYLIDKGSFAVKKMSTYHDMYKLLIKLGLHTKEIFFTNFEEMLENVNAEYLTQGIADMSKIENNSIDLIFSNAVLEHIDRNEISQLMFETHRVLKLGCTAQHFSDKQFGFERNANHFQSPANLIAAVVHQLHLQILRKTIALQRYLLPPKILAYLGCLGHLKSLHN